MASSSSLASAAAELGVSLSTHQLTDLQTYAERLATSATNLVSARDRDVIEQRHILESLAFGAVLQRRGLLRVGTGLLDLGAGGGLPGIPIKVAWPAIELTLLESVGRKCRFLEQMVEELRLQDTTVVEQRAEVASRDPGMRESQHVVVARAVAPLAVLVEYALPLLRVGGWLAAVKGSTASRELQAADRALTEIGGRFVDAPRLDARAGAPQFVVLIEKTGATPDRYPRREGVPAKRPLS
jgi:16S rRNA (guanine527-N7)-methyltransferase